MLEGRALSLFFSAQDTSHPHTPLNLTNRLAVPLRKRQLNSMHISHANHSVFEYIGTS